MALFLVASTSDRRVQRVTCRSAGENPDLLTRKHVACLADN